MTGALYDSCVPQDVHDSVRARGPKRIDRPRLNANEEREIVCQEGRVAHAQTARALVLLGAFSSLPRTFFCARRYVKCLYVYNKVDMISIEDMDKLAREPNSIVVSVHMKLNLDALLVR